GLLQVPRTTFRAGKPVFKANDALIQSVLGLKMKEKTGAYIGLLHGHGVPVYLDVNDLLQRHVCILAKTGGGKSYMSGDIIEELMKHHVTCMIIDPHGEYSAMRDVGKKGDARFGVFPRGYADHINEFTISKNADGSSRPLRFTLRTLEAREILELTRTNDIRSHLPSLRKAIDALRERQDAYSVRELIDVLSRDEDNKNPMLITELEYLDEIGIFATRGNRVDELIEEGRTTIINLKGVPPDIQELIVRRLGTLMFEMRKTGNVPPMMLIIEEAHNYCPQQGTAISSRALATIASEGRKFGLGLMVISQRPAKIDKNVLSQCGTQIILKVTNPNDVKAIAASVEGLTTGMTEDIQTMPIGIAMVVGAGIEAPLLVDVRPRESRHGGAGVKVLSEDD
ncbi:MAG: ATP-binding protein, partial [Methanomassiliicoccaceae archaeon]|nr:ATP-binding protein [Methanomassiliicoccaceae archaeon]